MLDGVIFSPELQQMEPKAHEIMEAGAMSICRTEKSMQGVQLIYAWSRHERHYMRGIERHCCFRNSGGGVSISPSVV